MNLNGFMQDGMDRIFRTAGRFCVSSGRERAFLAGMLPKIRRSAKRREAREAQGLHVPPFLIASVASQCNLRCAGCYAWADGACGGEHPAGADLTGTEWGALFRQAEDLGVVFVLLAGGEPLTRRDVLTAAGDCPGLIFPVFTNGTLLETADLDFFDRNRNLIPIFSVEGGRAETDQRRGGGVYDQVAGVMAALHTRRVLFGVSVTVTRENLDAVLAPEFLIGLREQGCGAVIYVEYVPAQPGTEALVLGPEELARLNGTMAQHKARFRDMVVLSFPGDEEAMGGCLASGRGFFHINARGGAEPCPFSPYARYNLRETSLEQVLASGYFQSLRELAAGAEGHTGGCTLFQREEQVKALLAHSLGED